MQRKLEQRKKDLQLDTLIEEQFGGERLLACISSRPGRCGRADGQKEGERCSSLIVTVLNFYIALVALN